MNILENILGGGQQQQQQQQDYQNFANRYDQGPPHEGYSDQEVMNRYNQVTQNLPPQQYMQAAQAAFERLSPQQREEFGQFIQQQGQQRGMSFGGSNYQDPAQLAQMTTQMHQQEPGLVGGLLGGILGGGSSGGQGGGLGGLLGGGGGGGSGGGMLSSPVAKAAMAGIAAMAVKQFMSQRH